MEAKSVRVFFELLRIILLFVFIGGLIWLVVENGYTLNNVTYTYSWLGGIAVLTLLFVLYRNKLQFSGWYNGKGKQKLSKKVTSSLIFISIILFVSPFLMSLFM